MKNLTIYCESREAYYSHTTGNQVTKWSADIKEAKLFTTLFSAENKIIEFKCSAMGDTKYLTIK